MSSGKVSVTHEGGVATVTLDNPQRCNTLNLELIEGLERAFIDLSSASELRAVILQGAGEHFCAGADINWMRESARLPAQDNEAQAQTFANTLLMINEMRVSVVVVAQGLCYGGGAGLCCAADITLATQDAQICFSETRLGLTPATISPYVVAAIGVRQARRLFLTGEVLDAMQARELGIFHAVCPAAERDDSVAELVDKLRQGAPGTVAAVKQLLAEVSGQPLGKDLAVRTAKSLAQRRSTAEAQEGLAAFLEKRKPSWCDD